MDYSFRPARVYFEPAALEYPRARELQRIFQKQGLPVLMTSSHNQVRGIPGSTDREAFDQAKQTLVIGIRRGKTFQSCKPSAHYQLPLATGCPGRCRYCYLLTTLGKKPYLRAYINIDEILRRAAEYIAEREPETTSFEGAAVSDPLFVEQFTGGVSAAINFFGGAEQGKFRLVTKFIAVEPFLELKHRGRTHFRFSINTPDIITNLEKGTPPLGKRLEAAAKINTAGYPLGFLVAPIFFKEGWRERYADLLDHLENTMPHRENLSFELITHRFTLRARKNIAAVFPETDLDMDTSRRRFRYGQFGYGKYLYPQELFKEGAAFFKREIERRFPLAKIEYFI